MENAMVEMDKTVSSLSKHHHVNVKYLYCSTQHRERNIFFGCIVLPV